VNAWEAVFGEVGWMIAAAVCVEQVVTVKET
jgi:hypothetical protein